MPQIPVLQNTRPPAADVRQRFDRAANRYDSHAELYELVAERLLGRLDGLHFKPQRIVDLGCGTGRHALTLRERFPEAQILALDCSPAMLDQSRRRRGRWRPRFDLALADYDALPLAQGSVDLAFANMSLQWGTSLANLLMGLRRIMQPDGMVLMTLPGPDTLAELKSAGADLTIGQTTHAQELGDWLFNAGFQEPVLDTDWLTTSHSGLDTLLQDLSALGMGVTLPGTRTAFEKRLRQPAENELISTWEVLYATAWSPGKPAGTGRTSRTT